LDQTFFGFKPEDRISLHENIFNLIWHGEGRWDWDTIYNMPLFLRKFYIKQINAILETKEAANEKRRDQQEKMKRRNITKSPR
jgi:hypothetical protein